MQSFKLKFSGVTILQGVEFPIFLLIFEWALQQCSATALPVTTCRRLLGASTPDPTGLHPWTPLGDSHLQTPICPPLEKKSCGRPRLGVWRIHVSSPSGVRDRSTAAYAYWHRARERVWWLQMLFSYCLRKSETEAYVFFFWIFCEIKKNILGVFQHQKNTPYLRHSA